MKVSKFIIQEGYRPGEPYTLQMEIKVVSAEDANKLLAEILELTDKYDTPEEPEPPSWAQGHTPQRRDTPKKKQRAPTTPTGSGIGLGSALLEASKGD